MRRSLRNLEALSLPIKRRGVDFEDLGDFFQSLVIVDQSANVFSLDLVERELSSQMDFVDRLDGVGEITNFDLAAVTQDYGPLDDITKFAQVSRPPVCGHRLDRRAGEATGGLSGMRREKVQMQYCEPLDILPSLAKRRKPNSDDV